MCIIVYKPKNENWPEWATLETCFLNNPDGAGFMYPGQNGVNVQKGLTTWEAFKNSIAPIYGNNLPVVMHFRIATNGGKTKGLTHPYPVTGSKKKLTATKATAPVCLAHNGIMSMTADESELSDTARFIKDYATKIIDGPGWYKDGKRVELLDIISDGRLAIMSSDGHVEMLGDWTQDSGLYFSNTSYRQAKRATFSNVPDWLEEVEQMAWETAGEQTEEYNAGYFTALDDCRAMAGLYDNGNEWGMYQNW